MRVAKNLSKFLSSDSREHLIIRHEIFARKEEFATNEKCDPRVATGLVSPQEPVVSPSLKAMRIEDEAAAVR